MTHAESTSTSQSFATPSAAVLMTAVLAVLPIVELLAISLMYDALTVQSDVLGLGFLLQNLGSLPPLIAAAATAAIVFGSAELNELVRFSINATVSLTQRCIMLTTHLLAYAGLVWSCGLVFGADAKPSLAIQLLWLCLALATLATWCASILPPQAWLSLASRLWPCGLFATTLGVGCWICAQFSERIWPPLSELTLQCSATILGLVVAPVFVSRENFGIGTDQFEVAVAPQCSGMEGLGLACSFMAVYLWFSRRELRFPRALLLWPVCLLSVYACNIARIVGLLLLGHFGYTELALGAFHSHAGWLLFNGVILGVVAWSRSSGWLSRDHRPHLLPATVQPSVQPSTCASINQDSVASSNATGMLLPFLMLTLSIPLGQFLFPNGYWAYPLRIALVAIAVILCRKSYSSATWAVSRDWFAPAVGLLVYVLWTAMEPLSGVVEQRPEFLASASQLSIVIWLACRIIGSVAIAPLAEEFAFRGYLIPWLGGFATSPADANAPQSNFWQVGGWTIAISAVVFGALHPTHVLAGIVAGLLYGAVYFRRGRVMDCVVAHATTNGMIALTVLITDDWRMWS